jgi:hypothetical protein
MILLAGFPLLVLQLSPADWMPEYTTILRIIFSLRVMAPLALLTIMPEWKSHCMIFHLLDVVESLSLETFLPGWTTTLTIIILLPVDVLATSTPLIASALVPADLTIIIPTNLEDLPTKTSLVGVTAYQSDRCKGVIQS